MYNDDVNEDDKIQARWSCSLNDLGKLGKKKRTSSATKASRIYDLPVGYFRRASTKPREKLKKNFECYQSESNLRPSSRLLQTRFH